MVDIDIATRQDIEDLTKRINDLESSINAQLKQLTANQTSFEQSLAQHSDNLQKSVDNATTLGNVISQLQQQAQAAFGQHAQTINAINADNALFKTKVTTAFQSMHSAIQSLLQGEQPKTGE